MPVDPDLLALLACPIDKGPLLYVEREAVLYNPRLRRVYRVENGMPVLMPDQGVAVEDAEHERLMRAAGMS